MVTENASGQEKLVSIICRTVGRPVLTHTLESVLSQTYPHIELILVNAANSDLSIFKNLIESLNTVIVCLERPLGRSEAANIGLEASTGDYLMFLDDDDWIDTDHITTLVNYLNNHSDSKAAYSSVQKTDAEGEDIPYVFESDYDPITLMRDNYIPIHAMVFARSLVEKGCRFDEAFNIYEDWDFWLQLSRDTNFHHIDKISAYYRQGGDSDTEPGDHSHRYSANNKLGKARVAIFEKWKPLWTGEDINQLIGELDQSASINDLAGQLSTTNNRLEEEYKKSGKLNDILELNQQKLEISREIIQKKDSELAASRAELDTLTHTKETMEKDLTLRITQLKDQSEHLTLHITQLVQAQNLILNSLSWKVTSPLRLLRSLFTPSKQSSEEITEPPGKDTTPEEFDETEPPGEILVGKFGAPANGSAGTKAEYDTRAKADLKQFFASDQTLKFPTLDHPALTVVLVFYNQAQLSLLCLRSLLEFADVSFRLIIVDNNSSDETPKLLEHIENAHIIRNQENFGFVRAVNQAAEQVKTEYLLLLNNDAVIEEATLSTAINTLKSDSSIGAVGAKIKLLDGSLQEAGSIIWNDGACLGYGRGQDPMQPEFMFQRDVDYCSGAFLLFRCDEFHKLGAFDEAFAPAYYEESDFCIRLQKRGKRIIYNPRVNITHYEFASSGGMEGASKLQLKHQQILCDKHPEYLSNKLANDGTNSITARINNKHPNILVIDDCVPHPSLGSGYPRSAHILNSLCELNLNVSFYPLQFPVDDWGAVYSTLDSTIEVLLDRGRAGLIPLLEKRKNFYQYIMVSRLHNMEIFNNIVDQDPALLEGSKVFYDAEAIFAPRDIMKMELLGQAITEDEKQKLIAKELDQARNAEKIISVSKMEADLYKHASYTNTVVLGHALQAEPGNKGFDERSGVLFVGALRDEGSPNVDSLLWFVINVLPIIEQEIPDIELYVVGDCSAPSLKTIECGNVQFLGRLDSITSTYNDRRLLIAPTRFAAGIPHKVHEAASRGIPSVTTSLLAKQLGWKHGKQLLVGDGAPKFAEQCVRLYRDEKLWRRVRSAGLQSISHECSDEKFQATLRGLFSHQS
ncbi:MAG: glycosyltransferase [Pseudomonadales bacterium]|nr:glycosyltransferase [Pseudomonadales bacterium]